jgi:hypothetical protein
MVEIHNKIGIIKMKKYLLTIVLLIATLQTADAAGPGGANFGTINDPYCAIDGMRCPTTWMVNRNGTKTIGRFSPNGVNYCNGASMNAWIMAIVKGNVAGVLTTNDLADIAYAKTMIKARPYRDGCCYSSDPNGTICLN